jgi:hypothetical protein
VMPAEDQVTSITTAETTVLQMDDIESVAQ